MWLFIFKSLVVFLILAGLAACCYHTIRKRKKLLGVFVGMILLAAVLMGGEYLYPFERSVPFHLYAEVELPEESFIPHEGACF